VLTKSSEHETQRTANEETMNQKPSGQNDEMLPEYDFSKGVRGKHLEQYSKGTNVVFSAPAATAAQGG
jgi:hypothetical protein